MKKVINKIFIYIFMLIIIFISVIPFVYMVMMSFKSTTNAYDYVHWRGMHLQRWILKEMISCSSF